MLIALLAFLFPLAWSPGPGNMVFAANGAAFGLRAIWPAMAGYHLATFAVTLAIGLGFSARAGALPAVMRPMQIAGAGCMLWLAAGLRGAGVAGRAAPRPADFRDGVMLLILNPKAYAIIVLMFSQFPTAPVAVTTVFTLNNAVAFFGWAVAGRALGRLFRSPHQARALNRGLALMLAGVALWMARPALT